MKLKNLFLAVIAAGAALVGCDPENIGGGEEIFTVSANGDIVIAKDGGSQTFTVKSTFDWGIRGVDEAADWLNVEVNGNSITSKSQTIKASSEPLEIVVSALANTGKDRSVTLTLFADVKHQVSIKVTQSGDLGDGITTTTVAKLLESPVEGNVYRLSGTVSRFSASYCSFDLTDETGSIYVYSVDADSKTQYKDVIKNGGHITIHGTYKWYADKSQHEIVDAVIEEYDSGNAANPDEAVDATVADFIKAADGSKYYRLSGTVSGFSDKYFSFDLTDETGIIYVYSVEEASKTAWKDKVKNGYKVVIRGLYEYYSAKSQHEVVNAIIDSVEEVAAETTEVTGLVIAVSSKGFLVSTADGIAYVFDADIAVAVKVGDNVTVSGEKSTYNGVPEIVKYTVTVNSSGNEVPVQEPTELDATDFDAYSTVFGLVKFSGKLVKSGNFYNIKVKDAKRTGSLSNPVSVDEALVDKWVDVTGYFVGLSGTSYFNVMLTDLALSEDQHEGESDEPEGAEVGENEVGYELTNAEIVAFLSSGSNTGDVYADVDITSAGGNWTGNINTKKTITYAQFRNNRSAHMKSPEYSTNVKRVVLRFQEQTSSRTVYAVPVSVIPNLPSQKDDNYNKTSHADLFANAYGSAVSGAKEECTKVITITGETKEFALLAYDGAVYLNSILVICEQ
ncbi:MAG: BACON domain-containing protein [Bacteroidales bacterium]|nr:BACON domain-containing protein [Bacteroidales bacterium]